MPNPQYISLPPLLSTSPFFTTVGGSGHGIGSSAAPWPDDAVLRNPDIVSVPKDEYNQLVQISQQYANLCNNLIRGGVDDATINLLSNVQAQPYVNSPDVPTHSGAGSRKSSYSIQNESKAESRSSADTAQTRYSSDVHGLGGWVDADQNWSVPDATQPKPVPPLHRDWTEKGVQGLRRHLRDETRTIAISNLAEGTTHADITNSLRGGQVLDVYLRYRDRAASVSFVYGDEAQAFLAHTRQHGLYIKQKRVDARWAERQFLLLDHTTRKIKSGATRNLVIRRCDSSLDENAIREDLEQIHNLVVLRVQFIGGDCSISTNSVNCATFARTCMMSRLKYKGSRIDCDVDECSQSLERITMKRHVAPAGRPRVKRAAEGVANRFQLLGLDEDDD